MERGEKRKLKVKEVDYSMITTPSSLLSDSKWNDKRFEKVIVLRKEKSMNKKRRRSNYEDENNWWSDSHFHSHETQNEIWC